MMANCDVPPAASLAERLARGDVFCEDCPSREILSHLTSRWGVLILVALTNGTYRFAELRRRVGGISEKMLAQTLRSLETDGLVNRTAHPVVPPHVDYCLTPLGYEAAEKVQVLADWVEVNVPKFLAARRAMQAAEVD